MPPTLPKTPRMPDRAEPPAGSDPAGPGSAGSDPAGPGPAGTDPAGADSAGTDPAGADPGDPGAPQSDAKADAAVDAEPAAAAELFGDRLADARRYVALLADAGVQRGLIGPREASRLWSRHLLNCAVPAPLLPAGVSVADVGSGAGLPGIPLALARPDCTFYLVEPLLRRTVFLAEVVAELKLNNVRVLRGRAEDAVTGVLQATDGGADVATSRAVAPLGKLARWSVPLLRVGGTFLPMKGSSAADELQRDAAELVAAGLGPATVLPVGEGIVDPVTYLVRAELLRRAEPTTKPQAKATGARRRRGGRKR